MVHEPEKSDLFTGAVKPANNSEGSEAESVERREGAEGNTSKHRTHRICCGQRFPGSSGMRRLGWMD